MILLNCEYLSTPNINEYEICCIHRVHQDIFVKEVSLPIIASLWLNKQSFVLTTNHTHFCTASPACTEDTFEPEM